MIESIKSKIANKGFIADSAIMAGTIGAGTVLAVEKNKLNEMDMDNLLTKEYGKYLKQVETNMNNINDTFQLTTENLAAQNIFNEKCKASFKILKKANKKNIIIGVAIGAAAGIAGVALKSKIFKGKKNENNTDKKQLLNIQS